MMSSQYRTSVLTLTAPPVLHPGQTRAWQTWQAGTQGYEFCCMSVESEAIEDSTESEAIEDSEDSYHNILTDCFACYSVVFSITWKNLSFQIP